MAQYHGTSGNDNLNQTNLGLGDGSQIFGEAGDDSITLANGSAIGGPGNDTITGTSVWSQALYWDAPGPISVNLATGLVQDGWGTVDTLVNIHTVHLTWGNDTVVGSSGNDNFWDLGGSDTIEGGAGEDTVVFWEGTTQGAQVTYDAASGTFTVVKNFGGNTNPGTVVLHGVENLEFRTSSGSVEILQALDFTGPFHSHITQTIPAGNSIQQWVEGDFNGDGHADLWVDRVDGATTGGASTPVQVLLGDGAGHFTDGTAAVFPQGTPNMYYTPRLAAADFNNDGITDVFAPDFGQDLPPYPGGQNRLFVSANGHLTDQSSQLLQRLTQGHGVSVADLDGNGRVDILVNGLNDEGGRADEVIFSNANGTFTTSTSLFPTSIQMPGFYSAGHTWSFMGDLNGDSMTDVVFGTWDARGGPSQVLLASAPAIFPASGVHALPDTGVDRQIIIGIKSIDLNGDALPDLVLSATNGGEHGEFYQVPYLQLLVNQGNGVFTDETQQRFAQDPAARDGYWYKFIDVVDFNGDGHDDMLVSSDTSSHSAEALMNDGSGHFTVARVFSGFNSAHAMDVNGDAIPEIVTGTPTSLTVYFNDLFTGDGTGLHFRAGEHPETITGGSGIDHVAYTDHAADYQLAHGAQGWTVTRAAYDSDTLAGIERVEFADRQLALDLDGHAGTVAKYLGAVFGYASVQSPAYVGIGLHLLDAGMSETDLMALAIDYGIGANASNAEIVNALYFNVIGIAAPAADAAYFTQLLDNHTYTPESLAIMAAETDFNLAHIGFAGLQAHGLAYA